MAEHRELLGSMRTAGELLIDLEGYQVVVGGRTVDLTRLQRDLLAVLTGHVGELVTHQQLAAAGWGDDSDRRVQIRNAIYKLRSMIRRCDRPPAIETVARRGYVLAVPPTSGGPDQAWVAGSSLGEKGVDRVGEEERRGVHRDMLLPVEHGDLAVGERRRDGCRRVAQECRAVASGEE